MGDGISITQGTAKVATIGAQAFLIILQHVSEMQKLKYDSWMENQLKEYANDGGEIKAIYCDRRLLTSVQNALFQNRPLTEKQKEYLPGPIYEREMGPLPHIVMEATDIGQLVVFVEEKDLDKARFIIDEITKRDKSLVSDKQVGLQSKTQAKSIISNLSQEESEAFTSIAKDYNLEISVKKENNGKYTVSLPVTDNVPLDKIYSDVYFASKGYGARVIDYKSIDKMKAIMERADSGEKIRVFSPTNPNVYIAVNETGFSLYKGNRPIKSVSKNQTSFREDLYTTICDQLTIPLVLSESDFLKATEQDRIAMIPIPKGNDEQEKKYAEIERRVQHLIHLKMSIENDPATEIHLDFLNPNVSFEQFMNLERVNEQNNGEILNNNNALKGLKEYYDSLSTEEQEYFYEYLSEYYSYVDTIHDKAEFVEVEQSEVSLEELIDDIGINEDEFVQDARWGELDYDTISSDEVE